MSTKTTVHLINHTHWDREWFLTSVYTSRWIPHLIDKLEELVAANPNFQFLFDGQTLVIEDLLTIAPDYAERVKKLIQNGRLLIGPYYCQPDWQLTGGELLIRNLQYGQQDVQKYGGQMDTGWLVDTFGHVSQAPQIHRLFGIDAVFVWRGVPQLTPYFNWHAPDGSSLLTINLFGGYRNLYGVTHAPTVAQRRLEAEVEKLRPFYPTPLLPLFDGYDLEDNPEDPFTFYASQDNRHDDIILQESTPTHFAQTVGQQNIDLPTIVGELNSGKFGATFPGTFSARTYLKVIASDCERLLFQQVEPLATMAALYGRSYPTAQFEQWGRQLLQNAVHDCICGVSIDQVHEKMAYSYQQIFHEATLDAQTSLTAIMAPFAAGTYVVSTNPMPTDSWHVVDDELIHASSQGVGVWPINQRLPITAANTPITEPFTWQNEHYTAVLQPNGTLKIGEALLGEFIITAEHGDTYSDEQGKLLGTIHPTTPITLATQSDCHATFSFNANWQNESQQIDLTIRILFDTSPLIKWEVDVNSRGTNFTIAMRFATALKGEIVAGMPFDRVRRATIDDDLLPRQLSNDLASVLLGQRELNQTHTFPMHDFVAITNNEATTAVLAKGIRAYKADAAGTIHLPLRRSVMWVTEGDLQNRVGDAGPFFYVPDARSERHVQHHIAVAVGLKEVESDAFQSQLAAYHNPPLIVQHNGSGTQTSWQLLQESLPLSSLQWVEGNVLARFYNPTEGKRSFSRTYTATTVTGTPQSDITHLLPKTIRTVHLPHTPMSNKAPAQPVTLLTPYQWRVGRNEGLPDTAVIQQLQTKVNDLAIQIKAIQTNLDSSTGDDHLRWQHRYYILKREQVEFQLSILLNQRKQAEAGQLRYSYLYEPDDDIAAIGLQLNKLRIKRRIFDYVVESLD